jgi:mitochondrial fission protein ELM1
MVKATILVDTGKIGTEKQCLALAESLNLETITVKVNAKIPWEWLPSRLWPQSFPVIDAQTTTISNIVIAGGRASAVPAARLRQKGAFVIFILNPRISFKYFDVVIAPRHDQLKGENLIETLGALNNITPNVLQKAAVDFSFLKTLDTKYAAVLIGGDTKHYKISQGSLEYMLISLRRLLVTGVNLWITFSRRTTPEQKACIRQGLKDFNVWYWDEEGANPYLGMLALADLIVVTADSVSMITEALSTGKPVYVTRPDRASKKIRNFYEFLEKSNYIKPFNGVLEKWSYLPLQETSACARIIQERFKASLR